MPNHKTHNLYKKKYRLKNKHLCSHQTDCQWKVFYNKKNARLQTVVEAFLSPFFSLPPHVMEAFYGTLAANPRILQEAHAQLWPELYNVYQNTIKSTLYANMPLAVQPMKSDKRFQEEAWHKVPYFRLCQQTYLLLSSWLLKLVFKAPMPKDTHQELIFYMKQWVNTVSPANFPFTNPEIVNHILNEGDCVLKSGISRLQEDWRELGPKGFFLELTKPKGFVIGKNLATTKGDVVYRNELCELIRYHPTQKDVYKEPLFVIPPWINKFYVFDLTPQKSFVKWALDQGHDVFILSWVNPDASLKETSFGDYLTKGLLEPLTHTRQITQSPSVHAIGYCLGGNLLWCALGLLEEENKPWIKTATFLTTIADFTKMEDLGLFLNEQHLSRVKTDIKQKGYMDGYTLALTFSLLRANDLIWPALVNKYFLSKDPIALDFLYWNADPVSLPSKMYIEFLQEIVHKNSLLSTKGVLLNNRHIKTSRIKTPCFIMAAQNDHIAPWKSCFPLFENLRGPKMFILSTAGHIAGVINPPTKNKYSYFHLEHMPKQIDATSWSQRSVEEKGSWWPFWQTWLQKWCEEKAPYKPHPSHIKQADAPGSYVFKKTDYNS